MTHLNSQGFFVSDKYYIVHLRQFQQNQKCIHKYDCRINKLVLSLNDPEAEPAIRLYAEKTSKKELGKDILKALDNLNGGK